MHGTEDELPRTSFFRHRNLARRSPIHGERSRFGMSPQALPPQVSPQLSPSNDVPHLQVVVFAAVRWFSLAAVYGGFWARRRPGWKESARSYIATLLSPTPHTQRPTTSKPFQRVLSFAPGPNPPLSQMIRTDSEAVDPGIIASFSSCPSPASGSPSLPQASALFPARHSMGSIHSSHLC